MAIYGPYMAIYGPYMAIYGHIWPIYGHIWAIYGPYMAIYGPYMAIYGPYMAIYGMKRIGIAIKLDHEGIETPPTLGCAGFRGGFFMMVSKPSETHRGRRKPKYYFSEVTIFCMSKIG